MSGSESSAIAIIWVLQRMVLFGQLVYAMLSVPRIPECFPFSLPLDLILDMRRMSRSVKDKPNGRVPLTKLKAYPRSKYICQVYFCTAA